MAERQRRAKGAGAIYQRSSDSLWVATADVAVGRGNPRRRVVFTSKDRDVAQRKLDDWLAENRPDAPKPDAPVAHWPRGKHMAAARAVATHTDKEWRAKCIAADHLCHYCGRPTASTGLHKDHIVPVSRGGSDGIDNLAVCCWDCNASKSDMMPDEFIEWARRTDFFNAPRSTLVYIGEQILRMAPEEHADYLAIRERQRREKGTPMSDTPRKRRPKGSGGLFRRSVDGMWIGTVNVGYTQNGGIRRRTVSSKSKAVAQKRLVELQRQVDTGQVAAAGSGRTTVKTWADEWLPVHLAEVRPKTQSTDKGAVTKWIVPTIGHRRLAELTPADVRALRTAIISAGRSSTTAGTYHRILMKMLGDAVREGHQVPRSVLAAKQPKKATNDRADIPVEQARAILAVIATRTDAPRWMLSFLTGMRQAEILGLLVDHVDLTAGTLLVEWQLQHPGLEPVFPDGLATRHLVSSAWLTETKTAKGERLIHLGPLLLAAMSKAIEDWQPNPWGLLWVNARGLPIRDYDDRAQWKAIQTEAGVAHPSGRPWHLHECRHTFITMLKRAGVDDSVIAQIVGQSKLVGSYVHMGGADAAPAVSGAERVLLGEVVEP